MQSHLRAKTSDNRLYPQKSASVLAEGFDLPYRANEYR